MDGLMPYLVSGFGIVLSTMVGMAVNKLTVIQTHLEALNGKFFTHVTTASVHEGGFARTDEQIKSLCAIVQKAHERIDRMADAKG